MRTMNWQVAMGLCLLVSANCGGGTGGDSAVDGSVADGGAVIDAAPDAAPPVSCTGLKDLPISFTNITGHSGSEDFAFDMEGNLVSNSQGNFTKKPKTGSGSLLTPNVGETAGTRYLSNGDIVIAQVDNGELWRIKPDGSTRTLLSGLVYPNGVEVDKDDFIYVSELDAGRIRRVNSDTGADEIIATGLSNPNGVSFSPDYKTLYVNSFGSGTIHSITVDDAGNWSEPVLLGDVFEGGSEEGCTGLEIDDLCNAGSRAGLCKDNGSGGVTCSAEGNGSGPFVTACAGVAIGQSCSVVLGNTTFAGVCEDFSGTRACNPEKSPESVCQGLSQGDACQAAHAQFGGYNSTCENDFGFLGCFPESFGGGGGRRGGLDGLTVDGCGNVYTTEYEVGFIWRFTPEGLREKVVELPSFWIPNMHWGSGFGGWSEDILYVMDREEGRVFELDLGVGEKDRVYP